MVLILKCFQKQVSYIFIFVIDSEICECIENFLKKKINLFKEVKCYNSDEINEIKSESSISEEIDNKKNTENTILNNNENGNLSKTAKKALNNNINENKEIEEIITDNLDKKKDTENTILNNNENDNLIKTTEEALNNNINETNINNKIIYLSDSNENEETEEITCFNEIFKMKKKNENEETENINNLNESLNSLKSGYFIESTPICKKIETKKHNIERKSFKTTISFFNKIMKIKLIKNIYQKFKEEIIDNKDEIANAIQLFGITAPIFVIILIIIIKFLTKLIKF